MLAFSPCIQTGAIISSTKLEDEFMEHKIMIENFPAGFSPAEDMQPFYAVRLEKMTLREGKILVPRTVGVRCAGYFRPSFTEDVGAAVAHDALVYGLTTAQFRLSGTPEELGELFTVRCDEMISEANAALERSESPVRLEEVVFGYADYCLHDGSYGASSQQYSGFVIGASSTRQVTVHKPKGIPGEWQCVCGAYNAPAECCGECGIRRPLISV